MTWRPHDTHALHLFEEHANSLPPFCEEAQLPDKARRPWLLREVALAVVTLLLAPAAGLLAAMVARAWGWA